jgi:hypothetical protein
MMNNNLILNKALLDQGYLLLDFPLEETVRDLVIKKDWIHLDLYFKNQCQKGSTLHSFLNSILEFQFLEHIIAIRSAPHDEDGIWHDDGSRLLGFSLSLNLDPASISGGELRFKPKSSKDMIEFSPLAYGKIVIFLSGLWGFEHQVGRVKTGERIVIAGWCS